MILLATSLSNQTIPIKRNQCWNDVVQSIQAQEEPLKEVQRFLKKHEAKPNLEIIDYQVLKNLDKAIEATELQVKKLKELRKSLEVGR